MSDERIQDRIQFRLRNVDDDLREAMKGLTNDKISDLARDGLRLILGIRTTKRLEIADRPINVVQQQPKVEPPAPPIRSKPTVFRPGQK